ncbi:MAG: hypothetical protein AABX47_07195 [Nanoarchaeota archaeon]|mgnify:CR=1 FL=1
MNHLKKFALATALGLSLSANSMYAAPKSAKPEGNNLSQKAFNQVIRGYDTREFIDTDGDRIDSADEARDVAHTTIYKMGGAPIAKATYDNRGRIVKLESIDPSLHDLVKIPVKVNVAPAQSPANQSQSSAPQSSASKYSIDWKHLDAVVANSEYRNSVQDLYKFGFGVDGFQQRKQLIRTYLNQRDYTGTAGQNEAHFAAIANLISERDASSIGPLYEAAKKMGSAPKQASKTAYTPVVAQAKKNVATKAPVAPSTPADADDSDDSVDTSAPSGDLEQKLYNAPANNSRPPTNNYGRANPDLVSVPDQSPSRYEISVGKLRNQRIRSEIQSRSASTQSLEQRASAPSHRDSAESASRQARYENFREMPSAFSSYESSKHYLWDIRVVGSRTAVHTQKRGIHTPLAQASDDAMRSSNPYGRQGLPHLEGNSIAVNAAFTKSIKDVIVKYTVSGQSSLTQWDMEVYAGARGFMNRIFTDSRSSHRALTHYNRVYNTTWHPIGGKEISSAAINQLACEFDTLRILTRHDYNNEYRNPRFFKGLAKGLLFGILF